MIRSRAVLAVTAAALLPAAVGCVSTPRGRDSGSAMICAVRQSPPTAPASPPGGAVRVVEQGFTQLGSGRSVVSLGAVLENTGEQAAYHTLIKFHVFDEAHQPVSPAGSTQLIQEIPVILPGRRIGVGAFSYVVEGPHFTRATVASFEVEAVSTQWVSPQRLASVAASNPRTNHYRPQEAENAVINYTVTSGYCSELHSRGVVAVYRDARGAIVGGNLDWPGTSGRRACSPGSYDEWVGAQGALPPSTDDSRTEIYPYCDPAPKPAIYPGDKPFN
jgi:hypothetical protein